VRRQGVGWGRLGRLGRYEASQPILASDIVPLRLDCSQCWLAFSAGLPLCFGLGCQKPPHLCSCLQAAPSPSFARACGRRASSAASSARPKPSAATSRAVRTQLDGMAAAGRPAHSGLSPFIRLRSAAWRPTVPACFFIYKKHLARSAAGICPYQKVVCLVVDECHRATGEEESAGWLEWRRSQRHNAQSLLRLLWLMPACCAPVLTIRVVWQATRRLCRRSKPCAAPAASSAC
jgi:hypothetical protein